MATNAYKWGERICLSVRKFLTERFDDCCLLIAGRFKAALFYPYYRLRLPQYLHDGEQRRGARKMLLKFRGTLGGLGASPSREELDDLQDYLQALRDCMHNLPLFSAEEFVELQEQVRERWVSYFETFLEALRRDMTNREIFSLLSEYRWLIQEVTRGEVICIEHLNLTLNEFFAMLRGYDISNAKRLLLQIQQATKEGVSCTKEVWELRRMGGLTHARSEKMLTPMHIRPAEIDISEGDLHDLIERAERLER